MFSFYERFPELFIQKHNHEVTLFIFS